MKRILYFLAISIAILASCDKLNPAQDNPQAEPQKGIAPVISELSTSSLIIYPLECNRKETLTVSVTGAETVYTSCGQGVAAEITKGDNDVYTVVVSALENLPSKSSVMIVAKNKDGESSESVNIASAYIDIDKESFNAADAGATVTVSYSSNVGATARIEPECSGWIHLESISNSVNVKIDRNKDYESRCGYVMFVDSKGLLTKEFKVTQDAAINYNKLEKEALIALYNSTDGKNWKKLSSEIGGTLISVENWCTDEPLSTWYGVELNSEGHVVYLHLSDLGLTGTLPEELGNLIYCQELWLGGNNLSGELPKRIGEMQSLKDLAADGMSLSGNLNESSLTTVADHLKSVSLSGNSFTGSFPEWISKMPENCNFWLQNNCLSGKIPDSVQSHPAWSRLLLDGSGKTVGQINMIQKEGYTLYE